MRVFQWEYTEYDILYSGLLYVFGSSWQRPISKFFSLKPACRNVMDARWLWIEDVNKDTIANHAHIIPCRYPWLNGLTTVLVYETETSTVNYIDELAKGPCKTISSTRELESPTFVVIVTRKVSRPEELRPVRSGALQTVSLPSFCSLQILVPFNILNTIRHEILKRKSWRSFKLTSWLSS